MVNFAYGDLEQVVSSQKVGPHCLRCVHEDKKNDAFIICVKEKHWKGTKIGGGGGRERERERKREHGEEMLSLMVSCEQSSHLVRR